MKPINRTDSLSRGREIPNSGGKAVLYAAGDGGLRKIRCVKCPGMATPTTTTAGKKVNRCSACGTEFASSSF